MSESQVSSHLIQVRDLGVMAYAEALKTQERFHDAVVAGADPIILTVEHPPVLTFGKNSHPGNLLFSKEFFSNQGVELFETERGGEVTAHVPGQLVVYPIMPILKMGLNARSYVNLLEQAVIEVLDHYGITANRDPEHPGVWVGSEKICALGIRIKSRVSMHGLALNVNNSLDLFGQIIPCGIRGRGVTTMSKVLQKDVLLSDVKGKLLLDLTRLLTQYSPTSTFAME